MTKAGRSWLVWVTGILLALGTAPSARAEGPDCETRCETTRERCVDKCDESESCSSRCVADAGSCSEKCAAAERKAESDEQPSDLKNEEKDEVDTSDEEEEEAAAPDEEEEDVDASEADEDDDDATDPKAGQAEKKPEAPPKAGPGMAPQTGAKGAVTRTTPPANQTIPPRAP